MRSRREDSVRELLMASEYIVPPWLFPEDEEESDSDTAIDLEFEMSLLDPEPWLAWRNYYICTSRTVILEKVR